MAITNPWCNSPWHFEGMNAVFECQLRHGHRGHHVFEDIHWDGQRFWLTWENQGNDSD